MRYLLFLSLILFVLPTTAQKKVLDHADFDLWNTVENEAIAPDGGHIIYSLEQGEADQFIKLRTSEGALVFAYDRGQKGRFTEDASYAIFEIKAWQDSLLAMKRRGIKEEDLPSDSLGIYDISKGVLEKIARVKSYQVPEKWSGHLAYQIASETGTGDSLSASEIPAGGSGPDADGNPKPDGDAAYHLVIRELATGRQDTFKFVRDYRFAKEAKRLAFTTSGAGEDADAGVFVLDLETKQVQRLHSGPKAKYYQLNLSPSGKQLGFVADTDTTKVQVRPTRLYYWADGMQQAELLAGPGPFKEILRPSRYADLYFSEDESRMYFGLASPQPLRDTTLLDEEIARVEVWTYDEPRLYTVQEMDMEEDSVRAYNSVVELSSRRITQLADTTYPEVEIGDEGNARYALASTSRPYDLQRQWLGLTARDYALVDLRDGSRRSILKESYDQGDMAFSPGAGFVFGYDRADSTWIAYEVATGKSRELTRGRVFYDELHDSPSHPSDYGAAGWLQGDEALILYDRYDLWRFDPKTGDAERLTRGREARTVYRYIDTDPEERFLDPKQPWLLSVFDENDKSSGYAALDPQRKSTEVLIQGPFRYGTPQKAKRADRYLFTRESFEVFPDLYSSGPEFEDPVRISRANPQQDDYRWGTIEQVNWVSLDGRQLTGLLVKPEGFDPSRKYPMIVNFYEKSSDRLHRHRAPYPGRSTINYSFYASRGYLIFNPDVYYREGYPGESAYNCVIPGVTSLVEQGFVDPDRIGVQGHSWGGYQIAYLVTRTNLFRAAEAGAPVPNMISAYGGIRWQTGLSRQFQYEHTQSRIGGTPWEYPLRYIENSPIFSIDKIQTPLLIMHNDADGHVPWYQGIEFFVSLRRLGKPSWFLNYNGEPHWPLKRANRKDFNIRMAQFFDHYLKGDPRPVWMERGVPPLEKGINQGYELMDAEPGE